MARLANGVGIAINGPRAASTEILLDGVENVNLFGEAVGQHIPLDGVQEYSVITSGFEAQYGRASGGIVNLASKQAPTATMAPFTSSTASPRSPPTPITRMRKTIT